MDTINRIHHLPISSWNSFASCRHSHYNFTFCIAFAFILSSIFVLNLYILVPKSVQRLSREDTTQIKWRLFSVLITTTFSVVFYPLVFCFEGDTDVQTDYTQVESLSKILGFRWDWRKSLIPIFHVTILYYGQFVTTILQHRFRYVIRRNDKDTQAMYVKDFINSIFLRNFHRYFGSNRWATARDFVLAPIAEEVIFRGLIIPPFLFSTKFRSGNISLTTICLTAPLVFGVAHLHHTLKKLKEPSCNKKVIILSALFQLLYTTLFGAYASFCLVKTGSLPGVILVHSFCNFMGLPSVGFFFMRDTSFGEETRKMLKMYKLVGFLSFILGITCFIFLFQKIFPQENSLLL